LIEGVTRAKAGVEMVCVTVVKVPVTPPMVRVEIDAVAGMLAVV
jgi:hypothetical protein